jgi:hypothetical protein
MGNHLVLASSLELLRPPLLPLSRLLRGIVSGVCARAHNSQNNTAGTSESERDWYGAKQRGGCTRRVSIGTSQQQQQTAAGNQASKEATPRV